MSLLPSELSHARRELGREPTETELAMLSAEWSEHCSYKSSRMHIKKLRGAAPHAVLGDGLDSGAIDVGDGYVVTAHIESHNHPSAVEPYGGAATGVGGVLRDIVSAGTRPIAVLDGLRFGEVGRDRHAAWLLRDAVRGISDYGNCVGVPTVAGEAGFDPCYKGYALVDVAAVGFGRRERLIRNRASPGDVAVLLGGPTGRDGVGGAQFASDSLESADRSAVQIPDPFMEKMVMEVVLETRPHIRALKDLGGGGLACAVSETAHALGVGISVDADAVHLRHEMATPDIMASESQERMLAITDGAGLEEIRRSCYKFRVPHSVIGEVDGTGMVEVRDSGGTRARLPASLLAVAPPLEWPASGPVAHEGGEGMPDAPDHTDTLYRMLGSGHCSSRRWIYSQYDHEVGIRTVVRPGRDGSLLRLDNGRYLAVSMDGNPRHCHANPYHGAMGCFEEACRNVSCVGARPAAMLDHLQFGGPGNPGVFRTFLDTVDGLAEYGRRAGVPCIGGKVSLYNETDMGPIKPSPVILVLGLSGKRPEVRAARGGDALFVIGATRPETGGSVYRALLGLEGGACPRVDIGASARNGEAARLLVREGASGCVHDCSGGGLAVALARMCMEGRVGCAADLGAIPGDELEAGHALFSESHSRYLAAVPPGRAGDAEAIVEGCGADFARIGTFEGAGRSVRFVHNGETAADVDVYRAREIWGGSLERMVQHG